jgi:predicted nucleic acid-binding protein
MADSAKAEVALVEGVPVVTSNFRAFSGIAGREVIG